MIPERPFEPGDRFRDAARAYLVYGIVYWVGGVWLALHGVGIRGDAELGGIGTLWIMLGLVFVVAIPYLLRRRRAWFERWILGRRDFARILTLFMAVRAWSVLRVVLRPETATVAAPWGGDVTYRAGAAVFFIVTIVAGLFVAVAAWSADQTAAE
jgi:hypothetical protein